MSCPVAYPLAWSRTPRDTSPGAGFGATRPVTDVLFCSFFFVIPSEGGR